MAEKRKYEKHPVAETLHDVALAALVLGILAVGVEVL